MSIYDITLADPTEQVAPPERLLRVRAVSDLAFVSVEKYGEDGTKATLTEVAEIAVSLPALRQALQAISDDGNRESLRERDQHGDVGRVWLNPPYSTAARWMHRLAEHGHGTALIFARTETRMWFDHVWPRASGLLFLKGRVRFCYVTGKQADAAGAPSVLVAYGDRDADVLASGPLPGAYVERRAA